MEEHFHGYHRLEAVVASSDRERNRAVALGLALFTSLVLHSATLGSALLAPRTSEELAIPARDIDLDLGESSDIDVRPSGVEGPEPAPPAAGSPEAQPPPPAAPETHTDIAVTDPDDPDPVPSARPVPKPVAPPSASSPPVRPPPSAPPTTTTTSSAPPAPSVPAPPGSTPTPAPSGSGTGAGSSSAPPGAPPPGFNADTPPATALLVGHFVRENSEGKDWATLAAGSRAELRAVLAVDAAGKTTCTPEEGAPAHLARALTNACFKLRLQKAALDVNRFGPGRVHIRITTSISDIPVPADRPDGTFGLEQRFVNGRGIGAFTQTHGRHVDVLIEVERIDADP